MKASHITLDAVEFFDNEQIQESASEFVSRADDNKDS